VGVGPGDDYETLFGVDASFSLSLFDVVRQGGGGERALGRHAVAALLSALHPDVAYAFSVAEVIALVQEAYSTGDFRGIKNLLEAENQRQLPEFCEEIGIG
jgi:hypothetical protein